MTQKKTDYSMTSAILAGSALVAAVVAPGFYVAEPTNGLTEEQVKKIVSDAVNGLNLADASKVDYMYEEAFKADAYEAYGEALALEELDSRDFKKALMAALNNNSEDNQSVESYRDIEDIRVLDIITSKDGKNVNVSVEFKVDFFNDGDSDEDDSERARYFVDFVVADAANDDDDDREDAEVKDDFSFRFDKFYN